MNLFTVLVTLFVLIDLSLCGKERVQEASGAILELPDDKVISEDSTTRRVKARVHGRKTGRKVTVVRDETEEICEKCKQLKTLKARKIEENAAISTLVAEAADDDDRIPSNVIARYRIRIPLKIIPPEPETKEVIKHVPSAVPVPKPYPVIQRVNVPQYVPQPYAVPYEVTKKVKVPYPVPVPVKPKLRVGYKMQKVMKPYVYHDGYVVKKDDVKAAFTGKEHEGLMQGRGIDSEHQEFDDKVVLDQFKRQLHEKIGRAVAVGSKTQISIDQPVIPSIGVNAAFPPLVETSAVGGKSGFGEQSVIWGHQPTQDFGRVSGYTHGFEPQQYVEG